MGNVVTLESTHGHVVATARDVPDSELVSCFNKFCQEAEKYACPVVVVNGVGYTNRKDFMAKVHAANEFSTRHGGTQIY